MARASPRRVALLLVVGLLLVTAGCSGAGNQAPAAGDGGGPDEPQATPGAPDSGDGNALQVRQRAIIRTGEVSLTVQDFDAARRNLTATVREFGGFVSDSNVRVHTSEAGTYRRGRLVLRVPSEDFSTMMERARAIGTVESSSTASQDVTDQLVDLEARLANLRAERDRLRQLYRNTSDTGEILEVEERLSEVQGEIERLEAQQANLERQVALSTIRVDLNEPEPAAGPVDTEQFHETPVLGAFLASVNGVIVTLRGIVVALAYALPYLLVFGLPLVGLAYGARNSETVADWIAGWRE